MATVKGMLEIIGDVHFEDCTSLEDEWVQVKGAYFKKILMCHPDKGGNAEVFRNVLTTFETLRGMYDGHMLSTFSTELGKAMPSNYPRPSQDSPAPPWEYYHRAAEDSMPIFRVELAKSDRSACKQNGKGKK